MKTPITDANTRKVTHSTFYNGRGYQAEIDVVDASVAQQLETELNEAKEAIVKLENACDTCKLYRELNEARAEIERLKKNQESDAEIIVKFIKDHVDKAANKDQLIEKLAGAINDAVSNGGMCDYNDEILREALQAYEEVKKQ